MSEPRLTNRTPFVVLGLFVLLGIAAIIGWRVYEGRQVPDPVVVAQPQVVDAGMAEPTPAPVNLAEGDALLKDAAGGLSPDPELARWLAMPDIVRRLVAATVQIGEGESPRETLGFIAVKGPFDVVEKNGKPKKKSKGRSKVKEQTFMSAKSTARYDPVAKTISSIDTAAMGALYAKVRPFAESVFREIAPPGKKLDDAVNKAIDSLLAVPLSEQPLEVASLEEGIGYKFVDPKLEGLTRAQKHLLRMGPANARVVMEKLKAFRAASSSQ